jgi:hypothetical protein
MIFCIWDILIAIQSLHLRVHMLSLYIHNYNLHSILTHPYIDNVDLTDMYIEVYRMISFKHMRLYTGNYSLIPCHLTYNSHSIWKTQSLE